MSEYNSSEDRYAVPDNNTEEFEQNLQQRHVQQTQQLEGGGPVEETGAIDEAPESSSPVTTDKAVKGGEGDYSWGGYEDQKKEKYVI